MNPLLVLSLMVFLNGLVLLELYLSYKDGTCLVSQLDRRGLSSFLPMIAHGGIWSRLMLITPVISMIVAGYGDQWTWHVWPYIAISVVINAVSHWYWSRCEEIDCLAYDNRLTRSGWVHTLYEGIALPVTFCFFFCTTHIAPAFLIAVSVLLVLHLPIATHMVLGYVNPIWWKRKSLTDPVSWSIIFVISSVIAVRTVRLLHL